MGRRISPLGLVFLGLVSFQLPGCATIRGTQDSIPELRLTTPIEPMDSALLKFASRNALDRGGLSKRDYRDLVVRQYSQKIEGRYNAFVEQLYSGERGTALGFDLLQLGLSAATGLVKPTGPMSRPRQSTAPQALSLRYLVLSGEETGGRFPTLHTTKWTASADRSRKHARRSRLADGKKVRGTIGEGNNASDKAKFVHRSGGVRDQWMRLNSRLP